MSSSGDVPSSFLATPARLTLPTLDEPSGRELLEPPTGGERYAIEALLAKRANSKR